MKPCKQEILISSDTFLVEIQNRFAGFFPFLKVDFMETNELSKTSRRNKIDPHTSLKHLGNEYTFKKINVDNSRTVLEVTNDLKSAVGYDVEVSRKSGNVWNVISVTDGWTLESQDSAGKYISSLMSKDRNKN